MKITMPGAISDVDSLIEIDNDFELKGSFNTVSVYTYSYVTEFQKYLATVDVESPAIDIDTPSPIVDAEDERKASQIQKSQSIEASLIVAYGEAKKKGFDVSLDYHFAGLIVRRRLIEQKEVNIGDIVYAIKSGDTYYDYTNPQGLVELYNNRSAGDIFYLKNEGREYEYELPDNLSYANKNLFYVYLKYEIDGEKSTPSFDLKKTETGGPSGGFLQTLSTYCEITKHDLTGGRIITGTGTMEVTGEIGAIGGIEQKIVCAIRANCDIFLCPEVHYQEALEAYNKTLGHDKMKLICIPNSTEADSRSGFVKALEVLEGLL